MSNLEKYFLEINKLIFYELLNSSIKIFFYITSRDLIKYSNYIKKCTIIKI